MLRLRMARSVQAVACSIAMLLGSSGAQALTVTGANFDIVYGTADDFGLYNVPTIVSNAIRFTPNPNVFKADALNGAAASIVSNAQFQIVAHAGFQLDSLFLVERGNYLLNGAGSSVTHNGFVEAFDPNDLTFFEVLREDILTLAPLTINDNAQHRWDARATVDVLNSPIAGATTLEVNLQNNLLASSSGSPSRAYIDKNFATAPVTLGVNEIPADPVVPLPAAVWLFGSGLLGLFGITRRPRKMH